MHRCTNPNNYTGIPFNLLGGGYQEPKTGDAYAYVPYFKLTPNPAINWRLYIQQKMAKKLIAGKSYCVTYWVSLVNYVNYGIDELAAYFDDGSIKSIGVALEAHANPQIKSPTGVFYTDTLNWMKVQDSFIANGTEEYITLGNFRTNAATTYTALDGNWSAGCAAYFIDDVSVIETDLPAYAGNDIYGIPGNTVYLGRPSEIGLDDNCIWYNLENPLIPIATKAGITVTVATTNQTYTVKQNVCGNIKQDTVIVYASAVGIKALTEALEVNILIYPNPSSSNINIDYLNFNTNQTLKLQLINNLGQTVLNENLKTKISQINVSNLPNGIYTVKVNTNTAVIANGKTTLQPLNNQPEFNLQNIGKP